MIPTHRERYVLSEDEMRHGVLLPPRERLFDPTLSTAKHFDRIQRRQPLEEHLEERLKANRAYCGLAWFGCIIEQELELGFDGQFASADYPNGYRPESPGGLSQSYLLRLMEQKYEFGSQW